MKGRAATLAEGCTGQEGRSDTRPTLTLTSDSCARTKNASRSKGTVLLSDECLGGDGQVSGFGEGRTDLARKLETVRSQKRNCVCVTKLFSPTRCWRDL
jgi:hypothetical protein